MTMWQETDVGLLHGVIRRADSSAVRQRIDELADIELVFVSAGELAAMLSVWPSDNDGSPVLAAALADPGRAAALALLHHDALAAAASVADVVPVRLGSIHKTGDSVRHLISSDFARFSAVLARIAGAVELGVRLSVPTDGDQTQVTVAVSGRDYLRGKVEADRLRRMRQHDVQAFSSRLSAALGPIVRVAEPRRVLKHPAASRIVCDFAMLVERPAEILVRQLIEGHRAAAAQLGVQVTLTGPWPAYSFAVLDERAETAG